VPITKAVQLLRIDREYRDVLLEKRIDDCSAGHLDRYRDAGGVPRSDLQHTIDEFTEASARMSKRLLEQYLP